jgi:hypothetical protein
MDKAKGVIILAVVAGWTVASVPAGVAIGHQLKRRCGELAVSYWYPQPVPQGK